MSQFREQAPANTGHSTTEIDPAEALFNAAYVFGAPVYAIENEPGPAAPIGPTAPSTEDPPDVTSQPVVIPLQPASHKTNSAWYSWPSGITTISVKLPNGTSIRALWFPVVTFPILISPGHAPGSVMYQITTVGGELVPVPDGVEVVSLTFASPPSQWSPIWVYVTGEKYPPFKAAQQSTVGQVLAYDNLILASPTLLDYWPLNDPVGTQRCADLGPANNPMDALGTVALGASGFLYDGATCAYSPANSACGLVPQSPLNIGKQSNSIEFWVYPTGINGAIMVGGDGALNLISAADGTLQIECIFTPYQTNVSLPAGAFYHFVCTFNADVVDVYLNGNLIFTKTFIIDTMTLSFLYDSTHGGQQLAGKMEKIAIYSGVLSIVEVRSHFAAGLKSSSG